MKILVFGGTGFVGRRIVERACERGHTVTLFNRGVTDAAAFPRLERIVGDRATSDLEALSGQRWDAVIDTSGYVPEIVGRSATLLSSLAGQYVFVSSLGVYRDTAKPNQDEGAALVSAADVSAAPSGGRGMQQPNVLEHALGKVLSEQRVEQSFAGRCTMLRAGLIAGYGDRSDRLTYWAARVARGGAVLAPGSPDARVQVMHADDFADFTLGLVEREAFGVFNVAGPAQPGTMAELLTTCMQVAGRTAHLHWVDEEFLLGAELKMYVDLPLWVSTPFAGINQFNTDRAQAFGLEHRSWSALVADALAWHRTRPASYVMQAGLSDERERELLTAWQAWRSRRS